MVPHPSTPGNDSPAHSAVASAEFVVALRSLLQSQVASWPGHGLTVVKERTVRTVFRGAVGGTPVHLKLFRVARLSDRARDALRGPKGRREFDHLDAARRLGLPVVEPLACGFASDGDDRRSFVATRTIDGAAPFTFDLASPTQRRVGQLLRRLHDLGVHLGDLHCGNLLIDGDGAPWLVDLTSYRHAGALSSTERADALALFCQELDGGALDARAALLLSGYAAAGSSLPAGFDRELRFATRRWRAAALLAFAKRSRRSCRHTEVDPKRRGQPRWFRHLAHGNDASLQAQCEALAAEPGTPTKSGRRGSVMVRDDLVAKEREQGKAQKLWRAAYWLLFARVPTARPVALRLFGQRGVVFTARVPNAPLATEIARGELDAAAVRGAAVSLGTSMGRLHAHGLRNRDLKLENLVRDRATGEIVFVDLDGVRRKAAEDARGSGADLGRLLAAFRTAGSPGGDGSVRAFLRAYLCAHRRLLMAPPLRRILRRAEVRAAEWAAAHPGAGSRD